MIKHSPTDEAHREASSLSTPRQEVTIDYYLEHCIDVPFWRWHGGALDYGMDPWTFFEDFPIDPEDAQERGWRIFVQVRDLPACA
jgi:hypothetical protein